MRFGVVANSAYDTNTGRPATITGVIGAATGSSLANFSYGFDRLGNLTVRQDLDATGGAIYEAFGTDGLNRLTNYASAASSTPSISSTGWKRKPALGVRDASPIISPAKTSSFSTNLAICPSRRPVANCCSISSAGSMSASR
jgi:hypothetical protein